MEYKITREQILELNKTSSSTTKDFLKEWFPDVFKPNFEIGKWYLHKNGIPLVNFQGGKSGFGFDGLSNWGKSINWTFTLEPHNWSEANPQMVNENLIKEFDKRFGTNYENDGTFKQCRFICLKTNKIFSGFVYYINYDLHEDLLTINDYVCYEKGIWAEIPKQIVELTIDEIALKFGVTPEQIKIKK